jgi:hypothetical protein
MSHVIEQENEDAYQSAMNVPPIISEMTRPMSTPIQMCHLRRRRRAASSTMTCLTKARRTETIMAASVVSRTSR